MELVFHFIIRKAHRARELGVAQHPKPNVEALEVPIDPHQPSTIGMRHGGCDTLQHWLCNISSTAAHDGREWRINGLDPRIPFALTEARDQERFHIVASFAIRLGQRLEHGGDKCAGAVTRDSWQRVGDAMIPGCLSFTLPELWDKERRQLRRFDNGDGHRLRHGEAWLTRDRIERKIDIPSAA
ncbi:MAG: hypothetical protein ACR2M1_05200 [Gemmatimonadaceae bacterium]